MRATSTAPVFALAVVVAGVMAVPAAADGPTPTPTLAMLPLRTTDLPINEVNRLNTLLRARATTRGGFEVQAADLTNDLVDAAQGLGLDCAIDTVACGTELGRIVDVRFVLLGQVGAIPGSGGVGVDLSVVDVGAGSLVRRVRSRLPQAIEARAEAANTLADLVIGSAPLGAIDVTLRPAVDDALVLVDGLVVARGPGPHGIGELAPGPHHIEVRARRFLPFVVEAEGAPARVTVPIALVVDPAAEVEVVSDEVKMTAFIAGGVGAAVAVAGGIMMGMGLQPYLAHGEATTALGALDESDPGYPALARDQYTRVANAAADWELWGGPLAVSGGVALGLGMTAAIGGLGFGAALAFAPPDIEETPGDSGQRRRRDDTAVIRDAP